MSEIIGIKPAARTTCIKPEGTASCVVMSASGIHGYHNEHYLRRVRFTTNEEVAKYLSEHLPGICEPDQLRTDTLVVGLPIKAPEGAIMRSESPLELLARVKHWSENWIKPGHIKGNNSHNVSATISIKDGEWEEVGEWMWENKNSYNGLSVLPYDGGTYVQAPFESITKEQYEEICSKITDWDLKKVKEMQDNTDLKGEIACAGGQCEI